MVNRGFNAVFLPIAVGICAFLDLVLLENPPPSAAWAMYYKETSNADFGIRMKYEASTDKTMTVIISYDSETESAANFFTNPQLPEWIDGFTACNVINWKFHPCTVSKFVQGHLVCASAYQCNYDKVHGCIASAISDTVSMGKFLICFFSGHTTSECGKAAGLDDVKIKECVNSGEGAQKCNEFHTLFSDARSKRMQTEAAKTAEVPSAITDFKTATCMVLAQGSLACPSLCSPPS